MSRLVVYYFNSKSVKILRSFETFLIFLLYNKNVTRVNETGKTLKNVFQIFRIKNRVWVFKSGLSLTPGYGKFVKIAFV